MPRKKTKIHEDIIMAWHLEDKIPGSREWKLIFALAEEEDFNDLYATSFVTDDTEMLCATI